MVIQSTLLPFLEYAVANSDPANTVLLGAVYYQLRMSNREVRQKVEKIEGQVEDLHMEHNGTDQEPDGDG